MKFTINRDQLLVPLQQIVGVIEKRQTMVILANVLLNIQDDQLVMTGSDTEIQLISRTSLESVAEAGSITVPARKLLDICKSLPAETIIKFELQDDKIKINTGNGRFSLSTLPAEHYPEFNESDLDKQISTSTGLLKKGLDKTQFCMANQDVRYYLNGLLLHISNSKLEMIASDGHRLSIFTGDLGNSTQYEERIILPRKAVLELGRLLDDAEAPIDLHFSANHIRVHYKNVVFSSKLIDAKFPDFSKVFNQAFNRPINVHRQSLRDALSRVAILSNEKYKGVTFDINNEALKLSTHNPEHDEAEEVVSIQYDDQAFNVAFNAQYVLDAVSNLDSDNALFTVASNTSACFIEEPENSAYKFIVMPMRL